MSLIKKFNPEIHHRRSIRLCGYDYTTPGAYFVTINTHGREERFGTIEDGSMTLNRCGRIVEATWNNLPNHNPHISLDAFVIMPNHVHWIIHLRAGLEPACSMGPGGLQTTMAGLEPAPIGMDTKIRGLPEIVRQFKSFSARRIYELRGTPGKSVWKRNYYEHIIRSESDLHRIRNYINNNPRKYSARY